MKKFLIATFCLLSSIFSINAISLEELETNFSQYLAVYKTNAYTQYIDLNKIDGHKNPNSFVVFVDSYFVSFSENLIFHNTKAINYFPSQSHLTVTNTLENVYSFDGSLVDFDLKGFPRTSRFASPMNSELILAIAALNEKYKMTFIK